jgi:hypothetical protein
MSSETPPPPSSDPSGSGARKALEILAVAFVLPVAVYLGFWLGGKAGGFFGAATLGGILGGALGAAAGFLELYATLKRVA